MKKFIYILVLSILCMTINACGVSNYLRNYTNLNRPRYAVTRQTNVSPRPSFKKSLKVVSYNIEYALKISKAIDLLKHYEELKDADVILLQEMDAEGVEKIAQALEYNYVYYPAVIHPIHGKDFGNAVLSKWSIIDDEKIILPNLSTRSRQRIAVGATLQIEDKLVKVFSLHMGIFVKPSERKKRVRTILETVAPSIDYCIVGGDFNTFTKKDHKEIQEAFTKSNFEFATEGIGWTNRHWYLFFNKPALDHIYTKGMHVASAGKIMDRTASDHLPIWTELSFESTVPSYQLTLKANGNRVHD